MIFGLFILLIILTIIFNIRGFYLSAFLLILSGIIQTIKWFDNSKIINNEECIIGNNKKVNGIIFNGCIDKWHILHIILYILIGLLYPNNYFLILVISIIWELHEHIFFKYIIKKSQCKEISCLRIEDIFLNLIGYFIGSNIR